MRSYQQTHQQALMFNIQRSRCPLNSCLLIDVAKPTPWITQRKTTDSHCGLHRCGWMLSFVYYGSSLVSHIRLDEDNHGCCITMEGICLPSFLTGVLTNNHSLLKQQQNFGRCFNSQWLKVLKQTDMVPARSLWVLMQGTLAAPLPFFFAHVIIPSVWLNEAQFVHAKGARQYQRGMNPELRTLFEKMCRLLRLPFTVVLVFDGPGRPSRKRGINVLTAEHWAEDPTKEIADAFGFGTHRVILSFHMVEHIN